MLHWSSTVNTLRHVFIIYQEGLCTLQLFIVNSLCFCVLDFVIVCLPTYPPSQVLCREGHGPFLLCAGVMPGPLHLHTFACCQAESPLTASSADCLPGPRPNLVGMDTQHGKAWHRQGSQPGRSASAEKLHGAELPWTDVSLHQRPPSVIERGQDSQGRPSVCMQSCNNIWTPALVGLTIRDVKFINFADKSSSASSRSYSSSAKEADNASSKQQNKGPNFVWVVMEQQAFNPTCGPIWVLVSRKVERIQTEKRNR